MTNIFKGIAIKSIFGDYDNSINSSICWFENSITDSLNFNYGIKFYNKHDLKTSILAHPKKLSFSAEGEGELLTGFHLMDANWKTSLGMFSMEANALTADLWCKTKVNYDLNNISVSHSAGFHMKYASSKFNFSSNKYNFLGCSIQLKSDLEIYKGAGIEYESSYKEKKNSKNKKIIQNLGFGAGSLISKDKTVKGRVEVEVESDGYLLDCNKDKKDDFIYKVLAVSGVAPLYDNYRNKICDLRTKQEELELSANENKVRLDK